MAEQESLIDISTKPEHRFFTVDDDRYELRSIEEFSISRQHALAAAFRKFARLNAALSEKEEELTADEGKKIEASLDDLVNSLVVDGSEVIPKLQDTQKLEIIRVFFPPKEGSETGISQNPSPASNGSTEAASATG